MGVENGGPVEASYTNSKLISRTQDSSTIGRVGLLNGLPESGAGVVNAQRAINKSFSTLGITGETDANALVYSSNERIVDTETFKQSIEKLDQAFNSGTGHTHSGLAGQGGQISAANLTQLNYYRASWQFMTITGANGSTYDVSTEFASETPGGGTSTVGVITSAPSNRVYVYGVNGDALEDAEGQRIYARITESAGVWTLSFYTLEAGVETAHALASQDIQIYFLKVFTLEDIPTIPSDPVFGGTIDVTADVVDASATQRGLMSTGDQDFAGEKTFSGMVYALGGMTFSEVVSSTTAPTEVDYTGAVVVEIQDPAVTTLDTLTDTTTGGINNTIVILSNKTGASITVNHAGALADYFSINGGSAIVLENDCALLLRRDDTFWNVIGGGGSTNFADLQLSNLTGTTAIPVDLLPATPNVTDIGADGSRWLNVFAKTVSLKRSTGETLVEMTDVANNAVLGSINYVASDTFSASGGLFINGPSNALIAATGDKDLVLKTNIDGSVYGDIVMVAGQNGANAEGVVRAFARALRLPIKTVDPSGPESAWVYYNSTTNKIRWYNGTAWADLGSGGFDVSTITTNTTLDQTANYFLVNATSGNVTLTINPATKFRYSIKRTDGSANVVSIVPSSGQIDGATVYYVSNQYEAVEVYADGTNLWVF